MKLSSIKTLFPKFEILKDAEFITLGMATSNYNEKGVLSFLSDEKYLESILANEMISAVITTKQISNHFTNKNLGVLISDNPKLSFYEIHNYLVSISFYWKSFKNEIDSSAKIGEFSIISSNSVKIGKNSIIESGVIINPGVIIGNNVIIRSGTILGTSGFQFFRDEDNILNVDTGGILVIEDNVEIQHNCCIDKGIFGGSTIIERNVKVDNLVHIAHDCNIGENTLITAGVKFGGRTVVGKNCWIGINATISNGIIIGDNAKITLGSVVTRDVADNCVVSGNFAIDHLKFINFIKTIR